MTAIAFALIPLSVMMVVGFEPAFLRLGSPSGGPPVDAGSRPVNHAAAGTATAVATAPYIAPMSGGVP
jgi:hypothetical protein